MTSPDTALASPIYWTPGPWLRRIAIACIWLFAFAGTLLAFLVLGPLTRGLAWDTLVEIALLAGFLMIAVVAHEWGHYLAARQQGMTVFQVRVGPVSGIAQHGRWRWRWVDGSLFSGGVTAFPDVRAPFRRLMLVFIVGGAMANVALAAIAYVASLLVAWPAGPLLQAFAIVNVVLGVSNLVPAGPVSDGTQLVRLWKGLDLGQRGVEALELNMRAMAGETADEAPEALLQGVEKEQPAIGLWFRAFAALNRQDWEALRAVGARVEDWHSLLDRPTREAWATLTATLRAEVAFGHAVRTGEAPPAPDATWISETRLYRPGTVERHEALRHAMAGRLAERDEALSRAERESAFSPDAASRKSEARLRDLVRTLGVAAAEAR